MSKQYQKQFSTTISKKFATFLLGLITSVIFVIAIVKFLTIVEPTMYKNMTKKANTIKTNQKIITPTLTLFYTPNPSPHISVTPQTISTKTITYTVKPGDTLWDIAAANYNDGTKYHDIVQRNNIQDPNLIHPNDILTLTITMSEKNQSIGDTSSIMTGKVTITTHEYAVQTNDSLWTIAEKAYGDGTMWQQIAVTNNLSNPSIIYKGMKLILPNK